MKNRGFLRFPIAGLGGNSKEKPLVLLDCRLPAARKRVWLANHFSLRRVRHRHTTCLAATPFFVTVDAAPGEPRLSSELPIGSSIRAPVDVATPTPCIFFLGGKG